MLRTPCRILAIALTLGTAAFAAPPADTDSLTGIPVYPSAAGDDGERFPGGLCHLTSQSAIYYVPFQWGPNHSAAPKQILLTDVEQWYRDRLKGFRFIPASDGQRPQDVFLSPDGTKAVTVTGNPTPSPNAYAISFTHFSGPVQPSQMKSLASHQKAQC